MILSATTAMIPSATSWGKVCACTIHAEEAHKTVQTTDEQKNKRIRRKSKDIKRS